MRALYREMNEAVAAVLQTQAEPYNFGLRFNKWAAFAVDGKDLKFDKAEYQAMTKAFQHWVGHQRPVLERALERQAAYAEAAARRKELVIQFEADVTSPLVIGIGGAHPSEVGLTFHWTLGVPYLPATSIKGLCRFALEVEEINRCSSEDELRAQRLPLSSLWTGKAILDEDGKPRQEPLVSGERTNHNWPPTVEHFGSQNAMGTVRFLDAASGWSGFATQHHESPLSRLLRSEDWAGRLPNRSDRMPEPYPDSLLDCRSWRTVPIHSHGS
jgi:CRISPR/Cas system CMR subunit Cmr6 (Cas7 group RAMP superfamily)